MVVVGVFTTLLRVLVIVVVTMLVDGLVTVEVLTSLVVLGSATRRLIELYVKFREVVPDGTTGGSVN